MNGNEDFMKAAFEQAEEALKEGEVPVGCVFVYRGCIISEGRNTVNETKNATRHAEINALDRLFVWSEEHNTPYSDVLKECTLYVTVEPCIMCADALGNLGLGKLIFGCSNDRFGGCGSVLDVTPSFPGLSVVKGLQAEKAIELLKEFYKGENPNAPTERAKRKPAGNTSMAAES